MIDEQLAHILDEVVRRNPGESGCHLAVREVLEVQQDATRDSWTFEHAEARLAESKHDIHQMCHETADEHGSPSDLVTGADIAGFHRVARAMAALGPV